MKSLANYLSLIIKYTLAPLILTTASYAAVFNIVPQAGTTFPTEVPINGSVNAFYTITNTTNATHLNNYIKTLPPNVTQVVSAGTCGKTFNLAPGQSCTLKLKITGPVNGVDPNPKNHLFACLGGCVTCCAGTRYPLNVTTNPMQYAYVVNQAGSALSLCQLINNQFINCSSTGDGFSGANAAVFNEDSSYVYVSNSGNDTISVCPVKSDHTLGPCVAYSDDTFSVVDGMVFSALGDYLYVTNFIGNSVSICPVNRSTHALGSCTEKTGFVNPAGITLNAAGTYAYISNYSLSIPADSTISTCAIKSDHTFGLCTASSSDNLSNADGISSIINNVLYVTNYNNNSITLCSIPVNNVITACGSPITNLGLNGPNTITFNTPATYAYITNATSENITVCSINKNGAIVTCGNDPTTFAIPHGILLQ